MNYNKLPADPTALILGIVALVIGFAGLCCYGIFAIIPLVLSIVGLVMANKSLKQFDQNPEAFSHQSRENVSIGKVLNIIALIFNSVILLIIITILIIYGTAMSTEILDTFRNSTNIENEIENDSVYNELDYIDYSDSTYIDSTFIQE